MSFVHPYIPNSVPKIKEEMMKSLGISSMEEIFSAAIPDALRFRGKMNLPPPIHTEFELKNHVMDILNRNTSTEEVDSFLGAGCYKHFIPALCDEIAGRAEFLTAYCAETYSDHGKMQAIFEYTSITSTLAPIPDCMPLPRRSTWRLWGRRVCASWERLSCRTPTTPRKFSRKIRA